MVNKIDIQDELPPKSQKARYLEEGSKQDNNDVRLSFMKADKRLKTTAANEKLVNGKLLLAST